MRKVSTIAVAVVLAATMLYAQAQVQASQDVYWKIRQEATSTRRSCRRCTC